MSKSLALLMTLVLSLFGVSPTSSTAAGWSIIESTSPSDGSSQVGGALVVGDAALILRCREQKTEAAYSTQDTDLGDDSVTVRYRINSDEPMKEVWRSSASTFAAFAPKPEEFIRALPANGRVFIRALTADGSNKDTNFLLSGVSEIRGTIARACNWSTRPDDASGSISQTQKR
jgi:hypothetical protein